MDDSTPATKGDIRKLREEMNRRFERVNDGIDQVLTVLVNVEKKVTGRLDNHEERIIELEKAIA